MAPPTLIAARLCAAAGLAAVALSVTATADPSPRTAAVPPSRNPCRRASLRLRCPDLVMSAPRELELDRTTIPGRVLLRATSSVNNRGGGPIELSAHRGRRRWRIWQAIYDRNGQRHLFPVAAKLVFKHVSGERYGYGYVGDASYWKLGHLAAFQLWRIGPGFRALRLVRTGPKVDYCLRDLFQTSPSPRSPPAPVYGGCSQEPGLRRDLFGTSVGWSDVYPASYPEQWIDVTGLRGRFAFVMIADPLHLFYESNERNNVSETYVQLPSGRVLGHRVGVSRP